MKMRPVIILAFLLLTGSELYAGIRVYMLPQVEISGTDIYVRDICKIDGAGTSRLLDLTVPALLYNDNLIDKDELGRLLTSNSDSSISVFGNGTMITFNRELTEKKIEDPVYVIKRGDTVQVEMTNGNITIVISGRSLDNGIMDEEIEVKLLNGKRIRCIITGEKQVRMIL